MVKKAGKGRPSYSPLEKAVSECVKNTEAFNEIKLEFDALLNLGEDEKRNEQLRDNANERLELAEEKDYLTKKIRELSSKGDIAGKEKYEGIRKERDKELREMAPLGLTKKEWNAQKEKDLDMERGRPSLEIEVKFIRAEKALNESKHKALQILAKEEKESKDLELMINERLNKDIKPGRPKSDDLGRLDKQLIDVKRKIEYIESGEAQKDREKKATFSEKGALKGRTPTPLDELLLRYQNESESISERIAKLESKLDEKGKLNRELKLLRDQKRAVKKLITQNENLTTKEILSHPQMAEIIAREQDLVSVISGKKGSLVTSKPIIDKEKINEKANKIAKAKDQELKSENHKMETKKQELSQEDDILRMLEEASEKLAING